jgi:hypothetical protein
MFSEHGVNSGEKSKSIAGRNQRSRMKEQNDRSKFKDKPPTWAIRFSGWNACLTVGRDGEDYMSTQYMNRINRMYPFTGLFAF